MTTVTITSSFSDDGSTSQDMQDGGHRTYLLPMISELMVKINAFLGGGFTRTYSYQAPLTGATLTASATLSAYVIEPAGTIAALNVVLPSSPSDGQVFELSTTAAITAISVTAPGGATVKGGTGLLPANSGMSWTYRLTNTTWYRRFG